MTTGYDAISTSRHDGEQQAPHGYPSLSLRSSRKLSVVLGVLSLFTTGSHYARHSLSGLGPALMSEFGVRRTAFSFLFSLEQLPGIILPVLSGLCLFLLRVPLSYAAVVIAIILLVSSGVCAISINLKMYSLLMTGRFVFGAAESLMAILQGAIIAHTFRDADISTAFGVMLLVSRFSSFAGFVFPPIILNNSSLAAAMWTSVAVLVIPVCATLAYSKLTYNHSNQMRNPVPSSESVSSYDIGTLLATSVQAVLKLRLSFWLLSYVFLTVASCTFTLLHFAPDIFNQMHISGINEVSTSILSGILFLVAGITSPLMGILADKFGRRPVFLLVASASSSLGLLLIIAVITTSAFMHAKFVTVAITLIMIGLCISPVLLLSCIAIVVPNAALPLALGMYKAVENLGLAIVHVTVGSLRDISGTYASAVAFLSILALSAIPAILLVAKIAPETQTTAQNHHRSGIIVKGINVSDVEP